jgi:tetratricopeptide (TPR) repeat protein
MTTNMNDNKFYSILGGILVIFAAVRIVFLSQLLDTLLPSLPVLDSSWYYTWAASLASGFGHPDGPFWLGPGYPLALAGLFKATGSRATDLIPVAQAMLSIATVIFLTLAVRKILGDVTALITAGIAALYAPWIYYDGMILSASWILFLNAVLLYLLLVRTSLVDGEPRDDNKELVAWGMAGLVCGLSAIARPSILIFAVLLIIAIFVQRQLPKSVLKLAVFVLLIGLVHLPILIRNWNVDGSAAFVTSSGGINFYIGNRDGASGKYDEAPWVESFDPWREAEGYRIEAQARSGEELTLNEASTFWRDTALREIFANKWGWTQLLGKKLWLTVRNEEIANNFSFKGMKGFVSILHTLPLHWGFVLPFALAGLLLIWPLRKKLWVCALYCATYLATNLIFFSSSEYRFPLILVLLPLAAYFVVAVWKYMEAKRWLPIGAAVAVYMAVLLISNWPAQSLAVISRPVMDYRNLGSMAMLRGWHPEAIIFYTRALTLEDDDKLARAGLADALWMLGSYDQAREEYARAGMSAPDELLGSPLDSLLTDLRLKVEAGDTVGAYQNLIEEFPDSSGAPLEINVAKAKLLFLQKRYFEAYEMMMKAHELDSASPEWLHLAGDYILETDDALAADSLYAAAIHRYPAYAPARIARAFLGVEMGNIDQARHQYSELLQIQIPTDTVRSQVDSLGKLLDYFNYK